MGGMLGLGKREEPDAGDETPAIQHRDPMLVLRSSPLTANRHLLGCVELEAGGLDKSQAPSAPTQAGYSFWGRATRGGPKPELEAAGRLNPCTWSGVPVACRIGRVWKGSCSKLVLAGSSGFDGPWLAT